MSRRISVCPVCFVPEGGMCVSQGVPCGMHLATLFELGFANVVSSAREGERGASSSR